MHACIQNIHTYIHKHILLRPAYTIQKYMTQPPPLYDWVMSITPDEHAQYGTREFRVMQRGISNVTRAGIIWVSSGVVHESWPRGFAGRFSPSLACIETGLLPFLRCSLRCSWSSISFLCRRLTYRTADYEAPPHEPDLSNAVLPTRNFDDSPSFRYLHTTVDNNRLTTDGKPRWKRRD